MKKSDFDPLRITSELIKIPSESSSPVGNYKGIVGEFEVMKYIRNLVSQVELESQLDEVLPGRPNLYIHIPNPGKETLIIDNHMDTVSAANMLFEPFDAIIQDGKLLGRGACDVKGAAGALLSCICEALAQEKKFRYDMLLAFTVDEETSFSGAKKVVKRFDGFDLCLAMEPTNFDVVIAHKGVYLFEIVSKGIAAHSSTPELGKNAIYPMLDLVNRLKSYAIALSGPQNPWLGTSSLSVNKIQGGRAFNIIPDFCKIEVDLRYLPELSTLDIHKKLIEICNDEFQMKETLIADGFFNEEESFLQKEFVKINSLHNSNAIIKGVNFATDCSQLKHLGPCIVWGPGDIKYAHTNQEFILIDDLYKAKSVLEDFLII